MQAHFLAPFSLLSVTDITLKTLGQDVSRLWGWVYPGTCPRTQQSLLHTRRELSNVCLGFGRSLCKQQSVDVVTSPLKIASLYLFSYPLCSHHLLPPTLIAAMPALPCLPGCRQHGAQRSDTEPARSTRGCRRVSPCLCAVPGPEMGLRTSSRASSPRSLEVCEHILRLEEEGCFSWREGRRYLSAPSFCWTAP